MKSWSWGLVRAERARARGSPLLDKSFDHQAGLEGMEEPAEFSYSAAKSARPEGEWKGASMAWLFKEKAWVEEGICGLCVEAQLNKIKT